MSYATVEAALLTVLRLHADYDANNSLQGDYRQLAKGGARFVVLMPGSVPNREVIAAPRRIGTLWEIQIQLFILFTGETSTSSSTLVTNRQSIMDHLDKYPTLNGETGVVSAMVSSAREPVPWGGESRNYWKTDIMYRVAEHVTVTIAE